MSDGFPWDNRTTLVFYALPDDERDPVAGTTSLVLDGWEHIDPDNRVFLSDGAPYLTVLDRDDLLETIGLRKRELDSGRYLDKDTARIGKAINWLDQLSSWVRQTGQPWFAYQLEPPEMAGDGTARAKGLAAGG